MSELYMEVRGQGSDVVLLHGWGLNLRVWDGVVSALQDRFRLIAVDLPGHGRSEWRPQGFTPAEQAWLLHASVASVSDRYALIGWSLGGQFALDLAAATPSQIDRLVLVATTAKFISAADWPAGAAPEMVAELAARLRADPRRTVSEFLDLQVRGSADTVQVREALRAAVLEHGEARPAALGADLDILSASDLRNTLSHVQAPALVIAGQHDRITLPAASRALAATLPHASYVEVPGAAHAPFLSHPREFASMVGDFLAKPSSRKSRTGRGHPGRSSRHTAGAPARGRSRQRKSGKSRK